MATSPGEKATNLFKDLISSLDQKEDINVNEKEQTLTKLRNSINPKNQFAIAQIFKDYAQALYTFLDSQQWGINNITPPQNIDVFFEQINYACNFEKREYIASVSIEESNPFCLGGEVDKIFLKFAQYEEFRRFITEAHILSIVKYNFYDPTTRARVSKNLFQFIITNLRWLNVIYEQFKPDTLTFASLKQQLLYYDFLTGESQEIEVSPEI